MCALLAALMVADAFGSDPPPLAPEPVLEWAQRDLAAVRRARLASIAALTGPGIFLVGDLAARSFSATDSAPQHVTGIALLSIGGTLSIVGPLALFQSAGQSRRALAEQGLPTPRSWTWLGVTLWGVSTTTLGTLTALQDPDQYQAAMYSCLAGYAGSLLVAGNELRENHELRAAAWMTLDSSSGSPTLGLSGTW